LLIGTGEIALHLAQTGLPICEQHVCTCLYFLENIVYAWLLRKKVSEIRPQNPY